MSDASANFTQGALLEKEVRERSAVPASHQTDQRRPKRPAHPSTRLLAQLNATWRVVDDPLQWILQRRKGNPRGKNSGWLGRSFCTTREGLLRCVRECCGEVKQAALAPLSCLPDHHCMQNLDVRRTDQAQAEQQLEPLAAQGLEVGEAEDHPPRSSQSVLT